MAEGLRNHNFSELYLPVIFSMGSGCAFHCTEEEGGRAGFEGWKGIFSSFGKPGVLKARCGSHVTGQEDYDFHFMKKFSSG